VQLSVIIVNYNVKYFLEHCLISVLAASKNIAVEIIVADNASSDESIELLKSKYPNIILIENKNNIGFAKANNQAVAIAKGEYILFLNPDTIVAEDCFEKCIAAFKSDNSIGGLGVHLIDGKGVYLPESKRGFPDFKTAFYKISGLNKIFKTSEKINNYYLGHLPEQQNNYVDVLVGCFMMMPKTLIDKIGAFDEDYFMYGEDIDLSYKITKAGFKNYYLATTSVIHYKGESTKKGSLNYVKMFYNAMIIFAQKHLSTAKQSTYIPLIKAAIFFKATLSVVTNFCGKLFLPVIDASIMLLCLFFTKNYWANNIKQEANYKHETLLIFFSFYIFTWLISLFLNGAYDKPLKKITIIKGMIIGVLLALAVYGLLPEANRFSRGITIFGAISATCLIWLLRFILQKLKIISTFNEAKNIIIVSTKNEEVEIINLLKTAGIDKDIVNTIDIKNEVEATILELKNTASLYGSCEIIFANPSLSFLQIFSAISILGPTHNFKIHAQGTDSIIGSNSKNTAGDLYANDFHFTIATAAGKRNKRLFDLLSSFIILMFSFILFFIIKDKNIFKNALKVLLAKHTWLGYNNNASNNNLPKLKPSIFKIANKSNLSPELAQQLNINYARNYSTNFDLKNLWQMLF
jgi:O-antigen biosynthesis protein